MTPMAVIMAKLSSESVSIKLPNELLPKFAEDLIRLGRDGDGGYLISKRSLLESKALLSCGLNDDWSFEKAFLTESFVPLRAYDGSVSRRSLFKMALKNTFHFPDMGPCFNSIKALADYSAFFLKSDDRKHVRSHVGPQIKGRSTEFGHVVDDFSTSDIFLKMDIEGGEWFCLDAILRNEDKFSGCVIEFHQVPLLIHRLIEFVGSLKVLSVCHVHVNNYGAVHDNGMPEFIEVTLSRRPPSVQLQTPACLPHPLDQACNPSGPREVIEFVPFYT